ncbi:MAG: four helix bundle protein [Bacteroidota bacterium]|nr:four helix bundle protein [Bacteroidota bacterium]
MCTKWKWFYSATIGIQMIKAADSIGANIAEGYGRYAYKKNIHFCYYSRGSLYETQHWLRRSSKRKLFTIDEEKEIQNYMQLLAPKLNAYINCIKNRIEEK